MCPECSICNDTFWGITEAERSHSRYIRDCISGPLSVNSTAPVDEPVGSNNLPPTHPRIRERRG